MAKKNPPEITIEVKRVFCPCGYHMLTAVGLETARAHNKVKHGGKYKLYDSVEDKMVPQTEPKPAPKTKAENTEDTKKGNINGIPEA